MDIFSWFAESRGIRVLYAKQESMTQYVSYYLRYKGIVDYLIT